MTNRTVLFQYRVGLAHSSVRIDARIARNSPPRDPAHGKQRHQHAEPQLRALIWRRPLEIIEVNPLRQLLCCPCSRHSSLTTRHCSSPCPLFSIHCLVPLYLSSLVSQCHHRVHCAQQNQRQRQRNMHEQPSMKPMMQPLLALQLPRLIANLFEVPHGSSGRGRQQRFQRSKRCLRLVLVAQSLPSTLRRFEKNSHFLPVKMLQRLAFLCTQQDNLRCSRNRRTRAGTDGGGSPQRHGRRRNRPQRGKPARALPFAATRRKPKRTAQLFHGAVRLFSQRSPDISDLIVNCFQRNIRSHHPRHVVL